MINQCPITAVFFFKALFPVLAVYSDFCTVKEHKDNDPQSPFEFYCDWYLIRTTLKSFCRNIYNAWNKTSRKFYRECKCHIFHCAFTHYNCVTTDENLLGKVKYHERIYNYLVGAFVGAVVRALVGHNTSMIFFLFNNIKKIFSHFS